MITLVDDAIAACVRARRWDDLEAAVKLYARALGMDPAYLFHATQLRRIAQHARTVIDPAQLEEVAQHYLSGLDILRAGLTLRQSIDLFAESVARLPVVAAFEAIQGADGHTRN